MHRVPGCGTSRGASVRSPPLTARLVRARSDEMTTLLVDKWKRHSPWARRHKNSRFLRYVEGMARLAIPGPLQRRIGRKLLQELGEPPPAEVELRLAHYYRVQGRFVLPEDADSLPWRRLASRSNYWFDLAEHLRRAPRGARVSYRFGDRTDPPPVPTLVKARKIDEPECTSVLFKLNKARHYVFVEDQFRFKEKRDTVVWRGSGHQPHRRDWVARWFDHPLCDIGRTDKRPGADPWRRSYLSIDDQLQHKFVLSLEGNDVATNLKWVLSSNSLCLMPRPTKESWFMEGLLEPYVHYIPLADDLSDLPEQVERWSRDVDGAERILANAQAWTQQFRDPRREDQLCLLVLQRYLRDSGQFD